MRPGLFLSLSLLSALLCSKTFSAREIQFNQAYDIAADGHCPPDGAYISCYVTVTNVSNLIQTVEISGGLQVTQFPPTPTDNGISQYCIHGGTKTLPNGQDVCANPSEVPPGTTKVTDQKIEIQPQKSMQFWFHTFKPGGAGSCIGKLTVTEDRGALLSTGMMRIVDCGTTQPGYQVPFTINGNRPY